MATRMISLEISVTCTWYGMYFELYVTPETTVCGRCGHQSRRSWLYTWCTNIHRRRTSTAVILVRVWTAVLLVRNVLYGMSWLFVVYKKNGDYLVVGCLGRLVNSVVFWTLYRGWFCDVFGNFCKSVIPWLILGVWENSIWSLGVCYFDCFGFFIVLIFWMLWIFFFFWNLDELSHTATPHGG